MSAFVTENFALAGTYGDGEVRLCRCLPEADNGIQVVLLHGVFSSANMSRVNKFRHLASVLAARGFVPWLVETSRRLRDKRACAADAWVNCAFGGKTYPQEQEDVFTAIREVARRVVSPRIWLWGFSLGGIVALAAAAGAIKPFLAGKPAIEKIILSGTGLVSFPNVEEIIPKVPILSSLRATLSPDLLAAVRTTGLISFRGSRDEVFPESYCRELVAAIKLPPADKHFVVIEGSDHAMRNRDGKACPSIMDEMVDYVVKTWL